MFYDHLIGRQAPHKDIYERVIKAPLIEQSTQIQMKSDQWSPNKAIRKKAQERAQKLQEILKKNWRLRLLFERGRVDPLCAAIKDSEQKKRKPS